VLVVRRSRCGVRPGRPGSGGPDRAAVLVVPQRNGAGYLGAVADRGDDRDVTGQCADPVAHVLESRAVVCLGWVEAGAIVGHLAQRDRDPYRGAAVLVAFWIASTQQ
jgi:hypothetical protein